MITRRILLTCPALAWGNRATAHVRAEAAAPPSGDDTELAGITIPSRRARIIGQVRLGNDAATVIAFAADLSEGVRDLLVVVAPGRVLALELLSWRGEDGSRLRTRFSAVSDRQRLRLERSASCPRGRGERREDWTDYLAWQGAAPMQDAPVRPVLAGTWQACLSAQRAGVRSMLSAEMGSVSRALVASWPAPCFSG